TERVLAFALRRIGEANVGVLAARRTDAAHATSSMLEAAVPEGRCERAVVGRARATPARSPRPVTPSPRLYPAPPGVSRQPVRRPGARARRPGPWIAPGA